MHEVQQQTEAIMKLSAGQPEPESIIRVEITAQTLNEKNEDGTWKYSDDQLREWLTKLRGDREVTVAKKIAKETGAVKRAAKAAEDEPDERDPGCHRQRSSRIFVPVCNSICPDGP